MRTSNIFRIILTKSSAIIHFKYNGEVDIYSLFVVEIEGKEYYFKVDKMEYTNHSQGYYTIIAEQTGYYDLLHECKVDIRKFERKAPKLVTDKAVIDKINLENYTKESFYI